MNSAIETWSIIAALAAAVELFALITLHLLPTGYSPVHDAVSDYGVGPYRAGFWVQVLAGGVAALALGIALDQLHPFTPHLVVVMLILAAAARFVLPFFPTDQAGSRFQTLRGTIHMILAVTSFGGLTVAATSLWSTLRHYPGWHGVEGLVTILPWVMLGSVIALTVAIRAPLLKRHFGVYERLFYLSSIAWLLVVSIQLAHLAS
jgi:hypothetical protein